MTKRFYKSTIYYDKSLGELTRYEGKSGRHGWLFVDITGDFVGVSVFVSKEYLDDYLDVREVKLLSKLYGLKPKKPS